MSQAAISTVGVLAQGLARFSYAVLIGRVLGAEELGVVSAWLALSLLLSLLWPAAAGNAAAHFLARSMTLGYTPQHALALILRSFSISCVVMVGLGVPIAVVGLGATAGNAIAVGALIVTYAGYVLARGILVGLGRISRATLWDVISSLTTLTLLAAVLLAHASSLLLWPITIGYAVFGAYTFVSARRGHEHLRPEPSDKASSVVRLIAWNSLGLIASNGLIQIAMLYVFVVESKHDAGLFAAAMSLATPASMLAQAISQVLIPRFTEWSTHLGPAAQRNYLITLSGVGGLLLVVFGAVVLASPVIVSVIYGSAYAASVQLMQLLLVGVFTFSVGLISTAYLIATGRTSTTTVFSLASLAIGVVVMLVGFHAWGGSVSAAAGVITGYAVGTIGTIAASLLSAPVGVGTPRAESAGA
jgi:O-antigen/teichoic acid export membrane protein